MSIKPRKPTTFTKRLHGVDVWSPELVEYAVNYLVTNTSWPQMYLLVELSELRPPVDAFFKPDLARFLIDKFTPTQLASLWASYRREDLTQLDQDVAA